MRLFKGQQQGLYVFTYKQLAPIPLAIHSANQHPHGSVPFARGSWWRSTFSPPTNLIKQTRKKKHRWILELLDNLQTFISETFFWDSKNTTKKKRMEPENLIIEKEHHLPKLSRSGFHERSNKMGCPSMATTENPKVPLNTFFCVRRMSFKAVAV